MKKFALFCTSFFLITAIALWGILFSGIPEKLFPHQADVPMFRTSGKQIEIRLGNAWKPFEIIGVNMGTGYPGLFPNETGIDEEVYYRWFCQISEMNVNTLRVYKIQTPDFYRAFLRYNTDHDRKLYLIQGVDFNDNWMYSGKNILMPVVQQKIHRDSFAVIDAVHGRKLLLDWESNALHCYTSDVSPYVLGYVLGVEWDDVFVDYICRINSTPESHSGTYLSCDTGASAFERFITKWGDAFFSYEMEHYNTQRLLSFSNWPNTDPFYNELRIGGYDAQEQVRDTESLFDMEKIRTSDAVSTGLFASYNVYPYFPSFLQYGEYTHYRDEDGNRNPYRKYLMSLVEHHAYPVVITEFGTPASRSVCYEDVWQHIHHGGLTEREQGESLLVLYNDIQMAGCAGSIVFTWQDEWYKTAWNEGLLSDADRRAYWSNAQCAEQFFGILSFEPGDGSRSFYPDGNLSEWSADQIVFRDEELSLSMHSDEKYVYFMIFGDLAGVADRPLNIALDVTPKSGSFVYSNTKLDRATDFIVTIADELNSLLKVHSYYDSLGFSALGGYHETNIYMMNQIDNGLGYDVPQKNSPSFRIVQRASGNITSTMRNQWTQNNAGHLIAGNANPESPEYNSNADYCFGENAVEIRIPWQLLNFYDPSNCVILDDFQESNYRIAGLEIDKIYAAAFRKDQTEVPEFGTFHLKAWGDHPQFHERLKDSYYILQEAFGKAES